MLKIGKGLSIEYNNSLLRWSHCTYFGPMSIIVNRAPAASSIFTKSETNPVQSSPSLDHPKELFVLLGLDPKREKL